MTLVIVIVLCALIGTALWWMNRRAAQAESETAYLPGGGPRPTIGTAVWRRVRREQTPPR